MQGLGYELIGSLFLFRLTYGTSSVGVCSMMSWPVQAGWVILLGKHMFTVETRTYEYGGGGLISLCLPKYRL